MSTANAARSPAGIVGTWDFKWPAGTRIRVAFQRPDEFTDADFRSARSKILDLATHWLVGAEGLVPNIAFVETDLVLEPPPVAQRGRQNRSPLQQGSGRDYEVLISLQRLPLERIDPLLELAHPGQRGEYIERITHPQSELGTYSLRVDDGAPSVYLGPPSTHKGPLNEYYDDPLARFIVLHEMGHVLGLAHEHQNPKLRRHLQLRYKGEAQIFEIANSRLSLGVGYDPKARDFVRADILRTWPGSEAFSDWREYRDGDVLDSVMSYPFHDCLLENNNHPDCGPSSCSVYEAILKRYQNPTSSDVQELLRMYGPR